MVKGSNRRRGAIIQKYADDGQRAATKQPGCNNGYLLLLLRKGTSSSVQNGSVCSRCCATRSLLLLACIDIDIVDSVVVVITVDSIRL